MLSVLLLPMMMLLSVLPAPGLERAPSVHALLQDTTRYRTLLRAHAFEPGHRGDERVLAALKEDILQLQHYRPTPPSYDFAYDRTLVYLHSVYQIYADDCVFAYESANLYRSARPSLRAGLYRIAARCGQTDLIQELQTTRDRPSRDPQISNLLSSAGLAEYFARSVGTMDLEDLIEDVVGNLLASSYIFGTSNAHIHPMIKEIRRIAAMDRARVDALLEDAIARYAEHGALHMNHFNRESFESQVRRIFLDPDGSH